MKRLYREAAETYRSPSRWSGKTTDQMVEEIGEKHQGVKEIYNLWFRSAGSFLHGVATGLFAYMQSRPNGTYTVRDVLPPAYERNPILQGCFAFMVVLDEAYACLRMKPPNELVRADRLIGELVCLTEKECEA